MDLLEDEENIPIYSMLGVRVGIGVMNLPGVVRFINAYRGEVAEMLPDVAAFLLHLTYVSSTPYLRGVIVDDQFLTGDVVLEARNGCEFVEVDGELQLNILGVDPLDALGAVVRSVNGVAKPDIWLQNHPRLNLRIRTRADGIRIEAAEDTV